MDNIGNRSIEMKAFQLKVMLRYAKPPIWRRMEVRGDTTLGRLHRIIQVAMGWTDSHMHQFVAKGKCYGIPDQEFGLDQEDEDRIRIDQVLRKTKDKLLYEYDFGDGWEHDVVVEKVLPIASGNKRYPMVTGGRRACPPEECGGIPGFYRFLEILGKPDHPEHEELLEWSGGEYDPERFDIQKVNRAFHGGWAPEKSHA
ncbi:MAG: plasmid pRiA4b ORF-3 family protein [Acidobacteriota bacterium]